MKDYNALLSLRLRASPDLEARIDLLRRFNRDMLQEIRRRDEEGEIPLRDLWTEMTALAEAVVLGALSMRRDELLASSTPPCGEFAIVAMGKFGGREITYRSDLDFLYLFENPSDQEFYTRLGQRIISALTLLTRHGQAYQIDVALRPSGNAGTLVSSVAAFQEYHHTMGKTWERQSLIKARAISGSPVFLSKLEKTFEEISYQECSPRETAGEIHHLRMRMEKEIARERPGQYNLKTGMGGIVDIEFAVQYLQLIHGFAHPEVRKNNTLEALETLTQSGLLSSQKGEDLKEIYLFYRHLETRLRMILDQPTDVVMEGSQALEEVGERYFGGKNQIPRLLQERSRVRRIYREILKI